MNLLKLIPKLTKNEKATLCYALERRWDEPFFLSPPLFVSPDVEINKDLLGFYDRDLAIRRLKARMKVGQALEDEISLLKKLEGI